MNCPSTKSRTRLWSAKWRSTRSAFDIYSSLKLGASRPKLVETFVDWLIGNPWPMLTHVEFTYAELPTAEHLDLFFRYLAPCVALEKLIFNRSVGALPASNAQKIVMTASKAQGGNTISQPVPRLQLLHINIEAEAVPPLARVLSPVLRTSLCLCISGDTAVFPSVAALTSPRNLELLFGHTELQGSDILALRSLTKTQLLYLSAESISTILDSAFVQSLSRMARLRDLALSFESQQSPTLRGEMGKACAGLEILTIWGKHDLDIAAGACVQRASTDAQSTVAGIVCVRRDNRDVGCHM
jgi:hypothetical protein